MQSLSGGKKAAALIVAVFMLGCASDRSTGPSSAGAVRFAKVTGSNATAQAVQDLIATINGMSLANGVKTGLTAPLKNINTNNASAACGKLGAFVNELSARTHSGQVSASQSSQLLSQANAIRVALGCIPGGGGSGGSPVWANVPSGVGNMLNGVWGSSASNVYAVGDNATVLQYNGTNWSVIPSFPVHTIESDTYVPLGGVWGTSASDVWVVGRIGSITHYNGSSWTVDASNAGLIGGLWQSLYAVSGTSASDAWAVGSSGTTLHFNGTTWTSVPTGLPLSVWLFGVWSASPSDVWAVGDVGTIMHYDGSTWTSVASGTTVHLAGVWGTSSSNVWAVGGDTFGGNGIILHYNGSTWSSVPSGTTEALRSVWGTSASDVWAVGENGGGSGTILHYDGTSWSSSVSNTIQILNGVWASSASDAWAVGWNGTTQHYH